jgi:hypothetical protein
VLWHTSVIPALGRLTQEDQEFKANLGYTARSCVKKDRKKKKVFLFDKHESI